MSYSNTAQGQRMGAPRKRYSWMLESQYGQALEDTKAKLAARQANRDRDTANNQWQASHNLQQEVNATAASAAETGMGMQMMTLGSNIGDKWGSGGNSISGAWSRGNKGMAGSGGGRSNLGGIGDMAGGAAMGYGAASIFGSRSDKNKKWGAAIGGLAGLMGFL